MRKIIFFLLVFILPVTGGAILQAQPDTQKARQDDASRKRICEKLDLSDAQKKQLGDMRTSMQRNAVQLHGKNALAKIDLRELLSTDEPDRNAIEKKLNEIAQLQTQQKLLRINHMLDMKKILTPEQLQKWKSTCRGMRIDGQRMRGNRRGMMMEPRGFMDDRNGPMTNRPNMAENFFRPMDNDDEFLDKAPERFGENPMIEDYPDEMETDW
jgi:Spy/CpxP family protein refolding chaperone